MYEARTCMLPWRWPPAFENVAKCAQPFQLRNFVGRPANWAANCIADLGRFRASRRIGAIGMGLSTVLTLAWCLRSGAVASGAYGASWSLLTFVNLGLNDKCRDRASFWAPRRCHQSPTRQTSSAGEQVRPL